MEQLTRRTYLLLLLCILLFSLGRDLSRGNSLASVTSAQCESFILPPFELNTLEGRTITQQDLSQGAVVLALL